MKSNRHTIIAVIFFALGFLLTINLFAQTETAIVRGQVTDPSGALVPGATVSLATGSANSFSAQSGAAGTYEIKGVPAGTYTLTVIAPGFESYVQTDLVVASGRTQQRDIALAIAVVRRRTISA